MLLTPAGQRKTTAWHSLLDVAVVAVATGVPIVGTLLACLGGVVAVLGPTAVYVGVAHGVLKASSIWRRFQPPAPAVRI